MFTTTDIVKQDVVSRNITLQKQGLQLAVIK